MSQIMPKIKHIVLLMLENRSLDNVLGWLYSAEGNQPLINIPQAPDGQKPTYDGLEKNKYFNPLTYGGKTAQYPIIRGTCGNGLAVPSLDPYEEYEHVNNQIFGSEVAWPDDTTPTKQNSEAKMQGFLQDFSTSYLQEKGIDIPLQTWHQSLQILQSFTPEQLPVLNDLAKAYAVSDRWFASVPTQTNPNRAFLHCGTSLGREKNSNIFADEEFKTDTIWNVLEHYNQDQSHECQCSWKIYYHDHFPPKGDKCYTARTFPNIPAGADRFQEIDVFYNEAKDGCLPSFSFLEPKWGWGINKEYPVDWDIPGKGKPYQQGNDYHPPTSNEDGEKLVRKIYESLRKSTAKWEQTLLVITFDEHGGTWDHVAPPWGAVPPDDKRGPKYKVEREFGFDRFGVRVPTLLISPYVKCQTVFRSETNVPYDHTSIIATILKWHGIDPKAPKPNSSSTESWLGRRVANAPTFEGVLSPDLREDEPSIRTPAPDRRPPITIRNQTPAQIYVYLGWGPDSGVTKEHKAPTTIWGNTPALEVPPNFPGSPDSGTSATYDTEAKTLGKPVDYWVQASYYVGPDNDTPPALVDSVLGLNKSWRLFWKGWRLITHHDKLIISLGQPRAAIQGPDTKGRIQVVNKSLYPIKFDIRYDKAKVWWKWGTLPPGKSKVFSTDDWINHKYYLALKYWTKGFIPEVTETWVDFWAAWQPVGRNATVTITQDALKISPSCGQ